MTEVTTLAKSFLVLISSSAEVELSHATRQQPTRPDDRSAPAPSADSARPRPPLRDSRLAVPVQSHRMKRIFGGSKTKSHEALADPNSAAPPVGQQQQQQPTAAPLPPLQPFAPVDDPSQLSSAPSQPPTPSAAGPKKRFGFGFGGKDQPRTGHSNGEGPAEGYEQARVGWGAPVEQAPPPPQAQVFVDSRPPRVENVTGVIGRSLPGAQVNGGR